MNKWSWEIWIKKKGRNNIKESKTRIAVETGPELSTQNELRAKFSTVRKH
jgi:hypothetical protein